MDDTLLPPLPLEEWEATKDTLHLWVQICRQDPARAHAEAQPLVERHPLPVSTRTDYPAHAC